MIASVEWKKSIRQLDSEGQLLKAQAEAWVRELFGERCQDVCATCVVCQRYASLDLLFEEVGE